ncbi:hydroxypyruvate isomerase family protein [Mycolicibacterium frederiksbergense]|uniref:hydroxypyruvate isomerase family protein n=1 Tax=Mycolicibacterium frederiksbergense TaxID=117567 RepID=UPI003999DC74
MSSITFTVNCSILLTDLPLLQRPQAARDAGFDAVEFWWPFATAVPADADVDAFVRSIQDAGVHLTGLNFAAGDMPAGDRGILSAPDRVVEFRENVAVAVGIAKQLGTRAFNALYGNRIDGVRAEAQDLVATDNLGYAAQAADAIDAVVLIEPVSGTTTYPLKTAADAVTVIERVETRHGVDNLRLLADLYHLYVNGDNVTAAISTYAHRIGHVQIADAPGRGEPGTGNLELARYLDELTARGYHGCVGLEYKPTRVDTFDWLDKARRGTVTS